MKKEVKLYLIHTSGQPAQVNSVLCFTHPGTRHPGHHQILSRKGMHYQDGLIPKVHLTLPKLPGT